MQLDDILRGHHASSCFQPIVDLTTASIHGYEALGRGPAGTALASPAKLIEMATVEGRLWELDQLFRRTAIRSAGNQRLSGYLFLNVEPNILSDPSFHEGLTRQHLLENGLSPDRVVFEVTERAALTNSSAFLRTLDHYRSQGYQIAIDDTGAGYSNLVMLARLNPSYIKLDMELIRGIHEDQYRQAIVKSFVGLARMTGSRVIAEGIEEMNELKTLIRLGVHFGQGFLLGRPNERLPVLMPETVQEIASMQSSLSTMYSYNTRYIGEIVEKAEPVDSGTCCGEVRRHMEAEGLQGVCVLRDGNIAGLVMRNHLDACLSGMYGFSLFGNKSILKLTDTDCLVVDDGIPVNVVSELAMARHADRLYDHVIVRQGTAYLGIVPVVKLLRHAIDIERSYALDMNPLTGLPGNVQINRVMHEMIRQRGVKTILYIDLDHFKDFNDSYGFEYGDLVIKLTKNILVSIIKDIPQLVSFIGHVGGDDFVAVLHTDESTAEGICRRIEESFDHELGVFLDGIACRLSWSTAPTSISIAGLCGDLTCFRSPEDLARRLSEVKKMAKRMQGSSHVLETPHARKEPREIA